MIHKIVNAVLGQNYVATALLYTGLALSLFAMTPSQAGITNAGEEDSSIFDFCFVCDGQEVTLIKANTEVEVTVLGTVMHGIWVNDVTVHQCKLKLLSSSNQPCVRTPVHNDFRQDGYRSTWRIVVPNVYQCQFNNAN